MFANKFGNDCNVCCGLVRINSSNHGTDSDSPFMNWPRPQPYQLSRYAPIPLVSVSVKAAVVHALGQVEITQIYVNREALPIEAVYYFPVNPEGAVTHFEAELDGRTIKGIVKPKDEARRDYNQAIQNNTTVFLGEEMKADIFKLKVGMLKPGSQVKVVIGYVTEVKNEPGTNAIRFYIPTTIAPRYISTQNNSLDYNSTRDIRNFQFSHNSPAPLSLNVAVSLQCKIKSIESPSHKVEWNGAVQENGVWNKAIITLAGSTTDMDRDFVLNIVPEEVHQPRLFSEKLEDGSTVAMLHFVPSFKLDDQKTELIFLLDRSGSMAMGGHRIELARQALLMFLHSMPADCYFNVIGFGSTFQSLFPYSVRNSYEHLTHAMSHARTLQANLGGTELLAPLQEVYRRPLVPGYLRQVFVLTDGEVSNTEAIIGLVHCNAYKTRLFSLGIGNDASHHLVEGIAKAGGGTSAFVTQNESIDRKVLNQLKNGLQPSLTDIELEWEGVGPVYSEKKREPNVNREKTLLGYNKPVAPETNVEDSFTLLSDMNKQAPKQIPPVYDGSQLLVFGLFKDGCPRSVLIKAQTPDGPLTLKVDHTPKCDLGQTGMLHRLAAVKLVRELELEESSAKFGFNQFYFSTDILKKEIVKIACENGITSRHTSFVAIDPLGNKKDVNWGYMQIRNVPSQLGATQSFGMTTQPFSFGGVSQMPQSQWPPLHQLLEDPSRMPHEKIAQGFSFGAQTSLNQPGTGSLFGSQPVTNSSTFSFGSATPAFGSSSTSYANPTIAFGSNPSTRTLKSTAVIPPPPPPAFGTSSSPGTFGSTYAIPPPPPPLSYANPTIVFGNSLTTCESTPVIPNDPVKLPSTPLTQLINLLEFDGSCKMDQNLADFLGGSLQELKDGAAKHNVPEKVFATAIAIAVFHKKLADEKDLWDLIVMKARKWLASQIPKEYVDPLIEAAAVFLGI